MLTEEMYEEWVNELTGFKYLMKIYKDDSGWSVKPFYECLSMAQLPEDLYQTDANRRTANQC